MIDLKDEHSNPQIWVKACRGMAMSELKEEIRQTMRSIRRLSPRLKDNFALNETSQLSAGIEQIFKVVNVAGWFIGIFAVLVGAFGIANIMFVSVKERTSIIGIQKALGAKSYYIILEVLYESVLLSLVGGLLGLLLIYAGTLVARAQGFRYFSQFGKYDPGNFHQYNGGTHCRTDACIFSGPAEPCEGNCQYFLGTRIEEGMRNE